MWCIEEECYHINRRFFTYIHKKRPYVILKWAQSDDGYIFPEKSVAQKGKPYWISNAYSLQRVHAWRTEEASILVGRHTADQDNPKLTPRDFSGACIIRLIIDQELKLPTHLHVFDRSSKTIVFNGKKEEESKGLVFVKLNFDRPLHGQILEFLYQNEISSVIVEGGQITLNSFIESGFWDEARILVGSVTFRGGIKAPVLSGHIYREEMILNDRLTYLYNTKEKEW